MKQYTTPEQTATLIELGFEKPKGLADAEPSSGKWVREAYSIGELIEMLPTTVESEDSEYAIIQFYYNVISWVIEYTGVQTTSYIALNVELIDALYDMCVRLKEDGVIWK